MREGKGNSLIAFPSDYTVIDIETTGRSPIMDYILELSAIRVRDNMVVDEFNSLVYLPQDIVIPDYISSLTGITKEMLLDAPHLRDLLKQYLDFFGDDILVGQNVNFDINFIYDNSKKLYGTVLINDFIDIMRIDKKLFKQEKSHSLEAITNRFDIDYSGAHRALRDCYIEKQAFDKMVALVAKTVGFQAFINLFDRTRKNHVLKRKYLSVDNFKIDEESPLYGKVCVITGPLHLFTREEAYQIIEQIGGSRGKGVTKSTNYLIVGDKDYMASRTNGKTDKLEKAEKYKMEGIDIEIVSEDIFYEMIGVENDD